MTESGRGTQATVWRLSVPRGAAPQADMLSVQQRVTLHRIGDTLIPESDSGPCASNAPDYDRWLDVAVAARADARDLLLSTLDQLEGTSETELDRRLRELYADDREGRFDVVSSVVAGAYLAGDPIKRNIGYPGQGRNIPSVDEAAEELGDGIMDPVIARGSIYIDPSR